MIRQKPEGFPPLAGLDGAALDAHIDAAPALVGLAVDKKCREGVKLHLDALANAARLVLEFELADEAEPAPVFRA